MAELVGNLGIYFRAQESLEDANTLVESLGDGPFSLIGVSTTEFSVGRDGDSCFKEGRTLWLAVSRSTVVDMLSAFDANVERVERGEIPTERPHMAVAESATEALAEMIRDGKLDKGNGAQ